MGQFASIISLSWNEILTLTKSVIKDEGVALQDLELITTSLDPRTPIIGIPSRQMNFTGIDSVITGAADASRNESKYIYESLFSNTVLPEGNDDFGVVLNYNPVSGDFQSLKDHLSLYLTKQNFPIALAAKLAAKIQPEVMASDYTPSVIYGRESTGNVKINDPYIDIEFLFWVLSFGIFRTGSSGSGELSNLAVVYSFRAATAVLNSTV